MAHEDELRRRLIGYRSRVPQRFARAGAHRARLVSFIAACAVIASLGVGCAGTPRRRVLDAIDARRSAVALAAYERFRGEEEPDGALLARVAALILEEAALGDDVRLRDAALSQLTLAGTASTATLERLAEVRGHDVVRARALAALAQRGDDGARDALRAMFGHADADVNAAAVRVLDAQTRRADLLQALTSPQALVRAAAADALRAAAPDADVRLALAQTARADADTRVRAAAARALGAFGASAAEALRERLADPDPSVRSAAIGALVTADRTAARLALTPLLALAPNSAGIEAARFLARETGGDTRATVDARAYLLRALESSEASLRVSAAISLVSLPQDPTLSATLRRVMVSDSDVSVRLLLATTLARSSGADAAAATEARTTLTAILRDGAMPGVQAAAALAALGDAAAIRALSTQLTDADPAIRRVAARALARDALRPDAARRALGDADATVRIAAAGGILSAHAAS